MAGKNVAAGSVPFFVGCGAYKHHVPASVDHLIQRSEFLTSYTPYQPEIAQGTLHYLFEFQTQVAMLTGMEVANASMYDGSTATAEAVLMAHRVTKRKKAVLSGNLHPHYRETVETVSRLAGDELVAAASPHGAAEDLLDTIDDERLLRRGAERRTCSGSCATCGRSPRRRTRPARCWSWWSPKRCRSASSRRRARWAPTSWSAEGQSIGNALELRRALCRACSRRGRNTCGRCRGGWSAKPSMPKASAASC